MPIPSCHIVCKCMHAYDSHSAEILDALFVTKRERKKKRRPSLLQTKIRPPSLQIAEISLSGLMQIVSPMSAGILTCSADSVVLKRTIQIFSLHNCQRNPRRRLARTERS